MELIGQGHSPTTLSQERTLAPSGEDNGRAPELHTHFGEEENLLPLLGFEPSILQPVA